MKRRTRLRKQGLPADPPKKTLKAAVDSFYDIAQKLAPFLVNKGLPETYLSDLNVIEDCRQFGIEQTVDCLHRFGMLPSEVRWRFGA